MMKLPKPKYAITMLDRVHFMIQMPIAFLLGTALYYLSYGIVQAVENHRCMNSDDKFYVAGFGVQSLVVILNIIFTCIFPIVFQGIFLRQKAQDQHEESDDRLMWLSKGLRFMLPQCVIYLLVFFSGFITNMTWSLYLFMPGTNAWRLAAMMSGDLLYSSTAVAVVSLIIACVLVLAAHVTVLLLIYRYFWEKWEREKNIGRQTMSADAYMSHEPKQ